VPELRSPAHQNGIFFVTNIKPALGLSHRDTKGIRAPTLLGGTAKKVTADFPALFSLHNFLPQPPAEACNSNHRGIFNVAHGKLAALLLFVLHSLTAKDIQSL
jgi:hypothetical protein